MNETKDFDESWINSQRIGILAFIWNRVADNNQFLSPFSESIYNLIKEEIGKAFRHDPSISHLPPSTLHLVLSLNDSILSIFPEMREIKNLFQTTLNALKDDSDGNRSSVINGAQVITHHMLNGTGYPSRITRFARQLLDKNWLAVERDAELFSAFNENLEVLRSRASTTEDKLVAIHDIDSAIKSYTFGKHLHWPQIKNVLYQQIFCWPLLVLDNESNSSISAISLPVMVDVSFTDNNELAIKNENIVVHAWHPHLKQAVSVAKELWRGKHGNAGDFREAVAKASSTFDFTYAEKIVSALPFKVELRDGSANSYFSQVVLSKLLGKHSTLSSAVTGLIGSQCKDDEGHLLMDYEFKPPGSLIEKLTYVFHSSFFERIVIPNLDDSFEQAQELSDFIECYDERQTAEINYAKNISNVADSVQIGGWRQFQYIRCPEIAWHLHPEGRGVMRIDDESVQKVLARLRDNNSCILELDGKEFSSLSIASALWHINTTYRTNTAMPPPMLHWAFIRAISTELDARFWSVLWHIIGATDQEFERLQNSTTSGKAAHILSETLNHFTPAIDNPGHRAPDIILIADAEKLSPSFERTFSLLSRPLAFRTLISEINEKQLLMPIYDKQYVIQRYIGKTRIILLSKCDTSTVQTRKINNITSTDKKILSYLSTFRFGFTYQMASLLLNYLEDLEEWDGNEKFVRNILYSLNKKGLVRCGLGQFYIPEDVRKNFIQVEYDHPNDNPTKILVWQNADTAVRDNNFYLSFLKVHYAAGLSFAPYCANKEVPSLAYDVSFLPENVHEAEHHFSIAQKLANVTQRTVEVESLRQKIVNQALPRIHHFADIQSWSMIKALTAMNYYSDDIYRTATELLDSQRNVGYSPHPSSLLQTCRLRMSALQGSLDINQQERAEQLKGEIEALYEEALSACNSEEYVSEKNNNMLNVLTNYSLYLNSYKKNTHAEIMAGFNEKALILLNDTNIRGEHAPGAWYELIGDSNANHQEAEKYYAQGLSAHDPWHSLWIKMFGASSLGNHNQLSDDAKKKLKKLDHDKVLTIVSYTRNPFRKFITKKNPERFVRERWERGLAILKRRWSHAADIVAKIEEFRSNRPKYFNSRINH